MINKEVYEKWLNERGNPIFTEEVCVSIDRIKSFDEDFIQHGFTKLYTYYQPFYKQIGEYTIIAGYHWDGNFIDIYKGTEKIFSDSWSHNLDLEETIMKKIEKHCK